VDAIQERFFRSVARVERVLLCQAPIDAISRPRLAASLFAATVSDTCARAPSLPGRSRDGLAKRMTIGLRHAGLVALLVGISQADADVPWRSVRGAELRGIFVDHELGDGVHYAYQFRGDGTFTGFNMGRAIGGSWRSAANEFCWTQRKSTAEEECFEVERRGKEVRFLRDGYEAFSGNLSPLKSPVPTGATR